jgi:hypothetical protein
LSVRSTGTATLHRQRSDIDLLNAGQIPFARDFFVLGEEDVEGNGKKMRDTLAVNLSEVCVAEEILVNPAQDAGFGPIHRRIGERDVTEQQFRGGGPLLDRFSVYPD